MMHGLGLIGHYSVPARAKLRPIYRILVPCLYYHCYYAAITITTPSPVRQINGSARRQVAT